MPTKDERRAQAAKHIALMKGAFSTSIEQTVEAAVVYEDGEALDFELPEPCAQATDAYATTDFASSVVQRLGDSGKIVVVDPASFTKPGGNYEDGGFGPEQALCSESTLYPVLRELKADFHDKNRGWACGQLFTGRALYLPDVAFVRDGDVVNADVIAIAEPNRARAIENHRSEREVDRCISDRIEAICRAAAVHGCDTLVCGAFGCGREAGDEELTIRLFSEWIEAHPGVIGTIVFAVPRAHFPAFAEAFGTRRTRRDERAERQAAEAAARESSEGGSDDDFDFRSVKLPEGVTLR